MIHLPKSNFPVENVIQTFELISWYSLGIFKHAIALVDDNLDQCSEEHLLGGKTVVRRNFEVYVAVCQAYDTQVWYTRHVA